MSQFRENKNRKPWPKDCPWPEPTDYSFNYDEDFIPLNPDDEIEELLEIKDYFDSLVEEGRLNKDYTLNEDYEDFDDVEDEDDDEDDDDDEGFCPEMGEDYWFDDRFDIEAWRDEYSEHMNLVEIDTVSSGESPVVALRSAFDYDFKNENLLRQAFTRRSFQIEYGLSGCSEELEFLGDTILSGVVVREIFRQFSFNNCYRYDAPFISEYDEGELTKIKEQFVSKEALASRARELGIGKFILYGSGEKESDSSLSDMMEALIGAVTIDSDWDEWIIAKVVNQLLFIQLDTTDEYLKYSFYDTLTSWHQKHFGFVPEYEVYEDTREGGGYYHCNLKYRIPDNEKGICVFQRTDGSGKTRSIARDYASMKAYSFIRENGLWKNMKDANVVPDMENSINQLQELYQKKYLDHIPQYEYEQDNYDNKWHVRCHTDGLSGWGKASGKVKAKKIAAYMTLVKILDSAGISDDEWEKTIWEHMEI